MNNKIIVFILSSIVFITIITTLDVYGAAIDSVQNIVIVYNPSDNCYNCYGGNNWNTYINNLNNSINTCYIGGVSAQRLWKFNGPNGLKFENPSEVIEYLNNDVGYWYVSGSISSISCTTPVIFVKGTYTLGTYNGDYIYDTFEEYEESVNPQPELTWWEIISGQVIDWFGSIGEGAEQIWTDFVDWVNGESSHGGGHSFNLVSPTPKPTIAPTPTLPPYTIQVVPTTDPITGDTIYQYQYKYDNPQGTPIITSAPPSYPSGSGDTTINVNGFEYPYYDNPENKDNPYQLDLPWYLKIVTGNSEIDESQLEDAVDLADNYINSENTSNGINAVYDSMTAFPTDLIALIGLLAAIPLIGALIHRLLG